MQHFLAWIRDLAVELQRRRVYRVVGLYAIGAFVILQVADLTFEALGIPDRAFTILVVLAAAGFPPVVALGWTFDLTARGLERTGSGEESAKRPGRRALRLGLLLAVPLLSVGAGYGMWSTLLRSVPVAGPAFAPFEAASYVLDPRRIAVLYLDDHSAGAELDYLAAGLTESLIHELSRVDGLDVVSRNGVKPFRDGRAPLDSIVAITRAGSLVEGSVNRSGERVRVTVQLIDGRTGTHLDSHLLEHRLDDLFTLQDSLATQVARSLRKRLGQEVRLRIARSGTESVEAWTAYNRGRVDVETAWTFWRTDPEATERLLLRADSLFRQARAADPDWPDPLVQRGAVAMQFAGLRSVLAADYDTAWARRAEEILDEAIARHPGAAEAWDRRGVLHLRRSRAASGAVASERLIAAEADLLEALRLDSEDSGAWWALSEVLIARTRFSEAVAAAERALQTDAFLEVEPSALHVLYYSTLQLGPDDAAVRWCEEGSRRFPDHPDFITCRLWILGSFPQIAPDVGRAWLLRDSLLSAVARQNQEAFRPAADIWTAKVIARAGLADSARSVLRRALGEETPAELAYDEAHVRLILGERDEAVRLLRHYLTYDPDTAYIRKDWWFADLRAYPPFRELVGTESTAN